MKQRVVSGLQYAALALLCGMILVGCGRRAVEVTMTAEERYQRGMRYYEDGNYSRAIDEFVILTRQFSGSDFADDAQYYKAMSYFNRGEYILSANEFEIMVNTMSGSPWVPESQYKLALSYYRLSPRFDLDQEYTRKAIDELQTFVDFFPLHERVSEAETMIRELNAKLARKEYENARLYMRMRYFRAATRYFEVVIERYHDTEFAELSYIGMAESLISRNRFEEAAEVLQRFMRLYPESAHRSRARTLEQRIAGQLSGDEEAGPEEESEAAGGNANGSLTDEGY